jgi:hypothetical protein
MDSARVLEFATASSPRPSKETRDVVAALVSKLQVLVLVAPWALFAINRFVDRLLELLSL